MGKPAARLTDMHTCPMVTPGTPPIPHVGGPISGPCVPPVLIGFLPAATVGDMCVCVGPPDTIAMGSPTVFIGGKMAARMGDPTAHGGVIVVGCPTVLIGEVGMGGINPNGALLLLLNQANPIFDSILGAKGAVYQKFDGHLFVGPDGKIGPNGISPKDVSQGQIGNCYLIAVLGAISSQNPGVIEKMIRANSDGTYTVTFHEKQFFGLGDYKPVEVTINSELPTKNGSPVFASTGDIASDGKQELWVPIIEKAYAEHYGGYNKIGNGGLPSDAFETILGIDAQKKSAADLSFKELKDALANNNAVTISSLPGPREVFGMEIGSDPKDNNPYYSGDNPKLVTGHAYYITGVDESKQTVFVKNPWGWNEEPISEVPFNDLKDAFHTVTTSRTVGI
jgi:uncharacterized Zn-binding protein involved in type VI secretion